MIYGYSLRTCNEEAVLLEMKEVTFSAPPETLREIAKFLSAMADHMEAGGFLRCDHSHIGSVIPDWDEMHPEKDIIVCCPPEVEHVDMYVE